MTTSDDEIQEALRLWQQAKEGDSNDAEHDTAGLVIDLLLDRTGIEMPDPIVCKWCGDTLHKSDDIWVDNTDGDCCSGDDDLSNENECHEPKVTP